MGNYIATVAALIFAAAGWLAFAKEWRAHKQAVYRARHYKMDYEDAESDRDTLAKELIKLRAQLTRLTDRDERGRFVKRERV